MSVGQLGQFGLNVPEYRRERTHGTPRSLIGSPHVPSGGMWYDTTGGQRTVFQADGVTAGAGKGPRGVAGTDFSISYNKPSCELTLTMLTAAARSARTSV